jgi:hypothetical protein
VLALVAPLSSACLLSFRRFSDRTHTHHESAQHHGAESRSIAFYQKDKIKILSPNADMAGKRTAPRQHDIWSHMATYGHIWSFWWGEVRRPKVRSPGSRRRRESRIFRCRCVYGCFPQYQVQSYRRAVTAAARRGGAEAQQRLLLALCARQWRDAGRGRAVARPQRHAPLRVSCCLSAWRGHAMGMAWGWLSHGDGPRGVAAAASVARHAGGTLG